ncbi:MAG: caspase family protein [candidate division KSB1 bacterium]|nr:caspase family protein [candidate division KSB1 bacterium]
MPRKFLLRIAINRYAEWRSLNGPVPESRQIEAVLIQRFGFEPGAICSLEDEQATCERLRDGLLQWVGADGPSQEKLEREFGSDDLLILYSGHGYLDPLTDESYWIPHDAGRNFKVRHAWFPHTELVKILRRLPFRHVLLISDSCFAGRILPKDLGETTERQQEDYPAIAARYRSREVLVSVGAAESPDPSPFAEHLLDCLRHNDKPWLDREDLYAWVRRGWPRVEHDGLREAGHQRGGALLLVPRGGNPAPNRGCGARRRHPAQDRSAPSAAGGPVARGGGGAGLGGDAATLWVYDRGAACMLFMWDTA